MRSGPIVSEASGFSNLALSANGMSKFIISLNPHLGFLIPPRAVGGFRSLLGRPTSTHIFIFA
jgi:hypothetical protein